jgi:membrane protein implicated in regulation of membrane protease activity
MIDEIVGSEAGPNTPPSLAGRIVGWLIQGTILGLFVFAAVMLFETVRGDRKQKRGESLQEMVVLCGGRANCVQQVEPAFDVCFDDHHRWRTVGRRKKQFELDALGLRKCIAEQGVDFP